MKRKSLLLIIPALMVLSSCAGAGIKQEEKNLFQEDTLAHEEAFGELKLMPRRELTPVESAGEPIVGVQYSSVVGGKRSIRFVAAIKVAGGNLDEQKASLNNTTAVWTRDIYDASGNRLLTERDSEIVATKAYNAINGGGDELTIADFGDGSYSFFVVYTMKNIPVASTSYLNAYLTIDSEGETYDKQSRVIAASTDAKTKFAFDVGDSDFFGVKKTTSGFVKFSKSDITMNSNNAQFEGVSFAANESFVIVNKNASYFGVYGADKLQDGKTFFDAEVEDSQLAKTKSAKSYFLYVSKDNNKIYVEESHSKTYYLVPNSNWKSDSARFAVNAYRFDANSVKYEHWYSMTEVESGLFSCDILYTDSVPTKLIFCRMNGGNNTNNWGNCYNQTSDQDWQSGVNDKFTTWGESWDWDNLGGTWSQHGA